MTRPRGRAPKCAPRKPLVRVSVWAEQETWDAFHALLRPGGPGEPGESKGELLARIVENQPVPVPVMEYTRSEVLTDDDLIERLALDRVIYGSSFECVHADGTRERIDPASVVVFHKG
jgi:hypothetical protein